MYLVAQIGIKCEEHPLLNLVGADADKIIHMPIKI